MPLEKPRQLRAICQSGKESDPGWYFAHRRVSIYITWALLHTPITPNQVTGLMMLTGAVGAAMLAMPSGIANLLAFPVLYLAFQLDKVDGEIARYRGVASVKGLLLDRLHHLIVEPMVFIAAAWHDHAHSGSLGAWTAGWAIVVLGNLVDEHQHLSAYIMFKHLRGSRRQPLPRGERASATMVAAMRVLRPLKAFRMFIVAVPLLGVAYAVEAGFGVPAIRMYLYASVVGLTVLLAFQATYYFSHKLEAEIGEQATLLAEPPSTPELTTDSDRVSGPHLRIVRRAQP